MHSSEPTIVTVEQSSKHLQPAQRKPVKKLISKKTAAAVGAEPQVCVVNDDDDSGKADAYDSPRGKENLEAMSPAWAHETELDNWCLQPLQRRVRRRPARTAQAAAEEPGTPAGTAHSLDEAATQQPQQQQHQGPPRQQQHDPFYNNRQEEYQDCYRQGETAATNDTRTDPEYIKPKRQRRTTRVAADDDHQPDEYNDPSFEPSASDAIANAGRHRGGRGEHRKAAAAGGGGGSVARVRMTAEEKAAQKAEQKAHKEAEKIAAKVEYKGVGERRGQ